MIIDVKNLQFTYPGNREKTIKGLDFSIEKGEIFGFLGPSGAGKSTIKKILIGSAAVHLEVFFQLQI